MQQLLKQGLVKFKHPSGGQMQGLPHYRPIKFANLAPAHNFVAASCLPQPTTFLFFQVAISTNLRSCQKKKEDISPRHLTSPSPPTRRLHSHSTARCQFNFSYILPPIPFRFAALIIPQWRGQRRPSARSSSMPISLLDLHRARAAPSPAR